MEAEKLYDCFKGDNKRRLLRILQRYPVTITELSTITGFKKPYVAELVRSFVEVGVIVRWKEKNRKMVIYMSPHLDLAFSADHYYVAPTLKEKGGIVFPNYKGDHEGKRVGRMTNKPRTKNKMTHFIANVFQLFEFNDPQLRKDLQYIRRHPEMLRGLAHLIRYNPSRTKGIIKEYNRRKEMREKNLSVI